MWNLFTHFFKCRHLIWLPVLCVTLAGCKDDFDDSELRKQIADLDGRLTSLEKLCAQMNTNISSMQTIVNALQQNDYITGVTPITEGSNTIGYTITFAKNKPITIYHGENGSTPVIGIKKDTDGIYYWTLDGEWLLDASDNKIKAEGTDGESGEAGEEGKPGQNGITPVLKIEEGYWYVSYDNENSWQQLGKASGEKGEPGEKGDSMFSSVDTSNDGYVIFTLADGTELKLPRKDSFGISFSNAFPGISAGETIEIEYTLPKGDEKTLVKTACQNGWQAVVNKKDHLSGTITITAPDPITDDEVLVFVSDGKEKTVMSAISFCIVILDNIQDNTVKVGGGDGNLTLEITSNMEIKAVPQNEWIITDEQPQSKALATNHFHFKVLANGDKQNRTGHIEVQDMGGKVLKTITV
ncbi:MAG: PL29 family lyase N-terminal domain-containing protein, partial [Odoribacter splanchnicus]